jgi:hypothetical protein
VYTYDACLRRRTRVYVAFDLVAPLPVRIWILSVNVRGPRCDERPLAGVTPKERTYREVLRGAGVAGDVRCRSAERGDPCLDSLADDPFVVPRDESVHGSLEEAEQRVPAM